MGHGACAEHAATEAVTLGDELSSATEQLELVPDRLRPGQAARRRQGSRRARPELAGRARRDRRRRDGPRASRSTPTAGPRPCSRPRCVPRTQRKPRRRRSPQHRCTSSEVAKLLDLGAGRGPTCRARRGRDPGQRGPRRRGVLAAPGARAARRARPAHRPHGAAGAARAARSPLTRRSDAAYDAGRSSGSSPSCSRPVSVAAQLRSPAGRRRGCRAGPGSSRAGGRAWAAGSRTPGSCSTRRRDTRWTCASTISTCGSSGSPGWRPSSRSGWPSDARARSAAAPSTPPPRSSSARVSRADEDAARERHETADFERQTVQESVTALETQLAGARRARAGSRRSATGSRRTTPRSSALRAEPGGRASAWRPCRPR